MPKSKIAPPEFVEWLNSELKARGWSFREAGRAAEVSYTLIQNIVTHGEQPSWDTCMGLARAFALPPETVLRRAGLLPPRADQDSWLAETVELAREIGEYGEVEKEDLSTYLKMRLGLLKKRTARRVKPRPGVTRKED